MSTGIAFVVTAVVCLAVGIWFGWKVLPRTYFHPFVVLCLIGCSTGLAELVTFERVIDGDTFIIDDGRRIRLHGVDTPEIRQPHGGDAAIVLHNLLKKKMVELRNTQDAAWGRTSAVVVAGGRDVALVLLDRGLAYVDSRYVDDAYKGAYDAAFNRGKTNRRGIWADDVPPWKFGLDARKSGRRAIVRPSTRSSYRPAAFSVPARQVYTVCDSYG